MKRVTSLERGSLRRDIVMVRRCPEGSQSVVRGRESAPFLHGRGRHTVSRDALRDPVNRSQRALLTIETSGGTLLECTTSISPRPSARSYDPSQW